MEGYLPWRNLINAKPWLDQCGCSNQLAGGAQGFPGEGGKVGDLDTEMRAGGTNLAKRHIRGATDSIAQFSVFKTQ